MSIPRVVATVEARMGSTRLPGKVLLPLYGEELLSHIVARLRRSQFISEVIIATTTSSQDDVIVDLCERKNIRCHRGSIDNILERIIEAARPYAPDYMIQATGDNPCITPGLVDDVILNLIDSKADYVGNHFGAIPCGLEVRGFTYDAIKKVQKKTTDPIDLVHGSYYIYSNPKEFNVRAIDPALPEAFPEVRLTVDEPRDYKLIYHIFDHFKGSDWSLQQLKDLFKSFPHLLDINSHVRQKHPEEA